MINVFFILATFIVCIILWAGWNQKWQQEDEDTDEEDINI